MKRTFFRDDKEILIRSLWFAHKVSSATMEDYSLTALSSYIDDERFIEKDRKHLIEIVAYTVSFVLDKIAYDINRIHGWTDSTFELHLTYLAVLGVAFNEVFGYYSKKEDVFVELFREYWQPDYNEEYKTYWGLAQEDEEKPFMSAEEFDQQAREILADLKSALESGPDEATIENYNVDKYHTFRVSKIYDIPDPKKFINIWKPRCSNLSMAFYKEAFFDRGLSKIKKDLQMISE